MSKEIKEDINIGEIEELCKLAHMESVQINVTVEPGRVEIGIEPWYETVDESKFTRTPSVKIDTIRHP